LLTEFIHRINPQEQAMAYSTDPVWDHNRYQGQKDRINAQCQAEEEGMRDQWLSRAGDFADWLDGSGCGQAYGGNFYNRELYDDADALKADERAARQIALEKLMVIALGATPYKDARIAAMDEIARRYVEHQVRPASEMPLFRGTGDALGGLTIRGVTK
jgi:hypothetical protein